MNSLRLSGDYLSSFDDMTIDELWNELDSSDSFHKGQVLLSLFNRKYESNDFGLAHAYAHHASEVFKESGHTREYALALVFSGNAMHALENFVDALSYYDLADEPTIAYGENDDLAILQGNKANTYLASDRFYEAHDAYMSAEALFAAVGMHVRANSMALELGDLQMRFGQYDLALETYGRARSFIVGLGDLALVTAAEGRISDALLRLGRTDEAIFHAREALNMSKTCPCSNCIPNSQLRLGTCLVNSGQNESGLAYLEKAYEAFHKINEPGMQGHCLFARAAALKQTEPNLARELLEQARSIYVGLDWTWSMDKVHVSIADLDLAEGNIEKAMAAYEQVLIRAKDLSRHGLENELKERLFAIEKSL